MSALSDASTLPASLREPVDAVVIHSAPPEVSSIELLRAARAGASEPPVIMTSGSPAETLEALRAGAYYVTRTELDPEEVSVLLQRLTRAAAAAPLASVSPLESVASVLIGETAAMRSLRDAIRRLRANPTTAVLITGESGSGKDCVARALHEETGGGGPFIHLSSLATPEALLERELFGFEGAGESEPGLLEQAEGGTLYLDEITEMSAALQTKLLRFLQERAFRRVGADSDRSCQVRVVATTSRSLETAVREGLLRPELAYRLAVITLRVPPLRERRSDIPLLVQHFVCTLAAGGQSRIRAVTDAALRRMAEYSWPGNVRELCNVLEGAALLSDAEVLDEPHLMSLAEQRSGLDYRLPSQGIDFRDLEREVLAQALHLASGNQTRAATLLGMTRDQIRYRMAKFGMT
ncbi:MAG TPA: sigma-54 dependent transcriptional regulator, partial [Polyangiaceae bacterium]|nr:sigma-54 dependent transcriptional regulator [Polyangiaceae bacterium]